MTHHDSFTPRQLDWEPQHIQRFWDWLASNPAHTNNYFAKKVGDAILDEVQRHVKLEGVVVDMGSGPGHILERLMQHSVNVIAIDTSSQSISASARRFVQHRQFLGGQVSPIDAVPLSDKSADIVLLIETIEHLGEEIAQRILAELHRVLKPGGQIVITTPNEENLADHEIMCPNCGSVFHTVQHMRSFSVASLSAVMEQTGFETVVCKSLIFSEYPGVLRPAQRLRYKLQKRRYPHLLYIGAKK